MIQKHTTEVTTGLFEKGRILENPVVLYSSNKAAHSNY
jgi:hypothetical protein